MEQQIEQITISQYNYNLPDDNIAKYPLANRDESKLLVYRNGSITDAQFKDITEYLPHNSTLIYNNTKVIHARLHFKKESGAEIEIFCLEPISPSNYTQAFEATTACRWSVLIGNQKRWKQGALLKTVVIGNETVTISATQNRESTTTDVTFEWDNPNVTFAAILEAIGEIPIPPYLNRKSEECDKEIYQTVYSKIEGSVAAPTAGLHFTPQVLKKLSTIGVEREELTLHVGAGTFKPVKAYTIAQHKMHTELITASIQLINNLSTTYQHITAVGTTSVRALETLFHIGAKLTPQTPYNEVLYLTQWEAYDTPNNITRQQAFSNLKNYMEQNNITHISIKTQIIIVPGYKFRVVDNIITNFHQPQSTLLLLVSAFVDGNWEAIYKHALQNQYRFLSYGDASLLQRV